MKQLLDPVLELIRLIAAHVLQPRPIVAERRIGHRGLQQRVVDAVEFEGEEQQVRGGRRQPLLHVAIKLGARRIDRIAGVHEPRIGAEPPHQIVERLVAPHRFAKRRSSALPARQFVKLALIGFLERHALSIGPIEIAADRRIVEAGIKVGEVPFRQRAERRFARRRLRLPFGGPRRPVSPRSFTLEHEFDRPPCCA